MVAAALSSCRYDAAPLFDKEDFKKGLRALVRWATTTAGASRVLLALPIPYPFGSTEHTTTTVVLPATVEVAAELSLQTVRQTFHLHTSRRASMPQRAVAFDKQRIDWHVSS
eukprot:SAG25_NODE_543_length_7045_cov_4.651166_2_plen_112_part_00